MVVIESCVCNWDIPGVVALPPHTHINGFVTIENTVTGKRIRVHSSTLVTHDWKLVESEEDSISVWVDWKACFRNVVSPRYGEEVEEAVQAV